MTSVEPRSGAPQRGGRAPGRRVVVTVAPHGAMSRRAKHPGPCETTHFEATRFDVSPCRYPIATTAVAGASKGTGAGRGARTRNLGGPLVTTRSPLTSEKPVAWAVAQSAR